MTEGRALFETFSRKWLRVPDVYTKIRHELNCSLHTHIHTYTTYSPNSVTVRLSQPDPINQWIDSISQSLGLVHSS